VSEAKETDPGVGGRSGYAGTAALDTRELKLTLLVFRSRLSATQVRVSPRKSHRLLPRLKVRILGAIHTRCTVISLFPNRRVGVLQYPARAVNRRVASLRNRYGCQAKGRIISYLLADVYPGCDWSTGPVRRE